MIKGFREFIMRGNVIDLAVAVVIATAFTAIVASISENLIQPIVALFGGDSDKGWATQLNESNPATTIHWDAIVNSVIQFLIVAAIVYFLFVVPMNKYRERTNTPTEEEMEAEELTLLREIRDELRNQTRTPN
jgi:large conductance mechanosensitive channel